MSEQQKPPVSEEAQRRKEELEEELEAYAHKGIFSPSFMKSVRWFSRVLWLVLGALLVFSFWDGWGKVPLEDYAAAVKSAKEWHEKTRSAEKVIEDQAAEMLKERLAHAKAALEAEADTPRQADEAQRAARNLLDRAWGEAAYARHWRGLLARAEPQGHGNEPAAVARGLMEQAADAPAAARIELLRELADLGRDITGAQARALLSAPSGRVRQVAALVLARIGLASEVATLSKAAQAETDAPTRREIWFAHAVLALETGVSSEVEKVYLAEYWLPHVLRGMDARQEALEAACREAPPDQRLELTALLCEAARPEQEQFMRSLANSERPAAERIMAVRWLARSKLAPELLKGLAEKGGIVGEEAKKAQ